MFKRQICIVISKKNAEFFNKASEYHGKQKLTKKLIMSIGTWNIPEISSKTEEVFEEL